MAFRRSAALALLAILVAPCILCAQNPCRAGTWTPPSDVALPDGRLVYVEAPYPARFSGGVMLLGTPTFVWRSATVFADTGRLAPGEYMNPDTLAGALLTPGGGARVVGFPPGSRQMLAPRAVVGADGWLDVFWGTSRDTTSAAPLWVHALWHARYDSAGWHTPDLVLARSEIDWNNATPDVGLVDGVAMVAVPVGRRAGDTDTTGIVVIRLARAGWSMTLIPTPLEPPAYVALDTAADGSAVVAFTGPLELTPERVVWNGAYVSRSTDHGATWSRPQLLADGGGAHVFAMLSALTSDGRLHVVWQQDSSASGGSRALMHAISTDGGANWSMRPRMPLPYTVQVLQAAAWGDRMLLVARREPARTLTYALIGPGGTDSLTPLPFPPAASLPRVAPAGPQRLMLVWGVRRPHSYPAFPAIPAPVLMASTFASRCDSVP